MGARPHHRGLSAQDMEAILGVTSALAAPCDLMTMLAEVVNAAKQVLKADRGSVWLYEPDTDELVLKVATGIRPVRVPAGTGLVGTCARQRKIINVPDCYADPRFGSAVDKASGYRTRCMLTLPLVDHRDNLVGVMGAMPLSSSGPAVTVEMRDGVILVLLSDGVYEYGNAANEQFGEEQVEQIHRAHRTATMAELSSRSSRSRRSRTAPRRRTTSRWSW